MPKNIKIGRDDKVEVRKDGRLLLDVAIANSSNTKRVNLSFKTDDQELLLQRVKMRPPPNKGDRLI